MRAVPLRNRNGEVVAEALVDDEDFDRVMAAGPWHLNHGYAAHIDWNGGAQTKTYLHRFVLGLNPGDPHADHRNRDRLDNRRENLRYPVTDAQNRQNVPSYRGASSKYRGVSRCKQTQRWRATIRLGGKQVHLGRFDSEEEAAAVAAAARRDHMPFSEEAA